MINYQQQEETQDRSEALVRANNFMSFRLGGYPLLGWLILRISLRLLMESDMTPENWKELDKMLMGIAAFFVALPIFLDWSEEKNFTGYNGNRLLAVLGGLFAGQPFIWFVKTLFFIGLCVVFLDFFTLMTWWTWLARSAAFIGLMFGGVFLNVYLRKAFEECTGYSREWY